MSFAINALTPHNAALTGGCACGPATSVNNGAQQEPEHPAVNQDKAALQQSVQEQAELSRFRERDREVRSHEQAHVAAGGQHVLGGVQYDLQKGPDGNLYAMGGSVKLDTSPVPGDPEATMEKARDVRRAALAPSEPSAQDRNVAAEASAVESQARTELQMQASSLRAEPGMQSAATRQNDAPTTAEIMTRRAVTGYGDFGAPQPGTHFRASA